MNVVQSTRHLRRVLATSTTTVHRHFLPITTATATVHHRLYSAASSPSPSHTPPALPSAVLCRLEEFYDSVLAEDLAILSYDHRQVNPNSPFLRVLETADTELNAAFRDQCALRHEVAMERQTVEDDRAKKKKRATFDARLVGSKWNRRRLKLLAESRAMVADQLLLSNETATEDVSSATDDRFKRFLTPAVHVTEKDLPPVYERLPYLRQLTIRMTMLHAVSHSRKVLLNGLLALQLVTTQQGQIFVAEKGDAQLRIREGMPLGVEVTLSDPKLMYGFIDKMVEMVLPKLRDFAGFSYYAGADSLNRGHLILRFDAETWLAFPEIQQAYRKFPQLGSIGSLQEFEVEFETTAKNDEETRLLLSGFRLPFVYNEPPLMRDEKPEGDNVQDV